MLHHLSFGVRNLALSGAFYDAALGALGFRRVFDGEESIGYGLVDDQDRLLLNLDPNASAPGPGFHLAFSAPSRAAVDAFHAVALRVGGEDNGGPGLRPEYGPHYYAAFLIDPDGYRIEAIHSGIRCEPVAGSRKPSVALPLTPHSSLLTPQRSTLHHYSGLRRARGCAPS